jgi:CRISPR system Cascade subunit CasE
MDRDHAEVDAFLAKAWQVGSEMHVDRTAVYEEWLREQFERDGAARIEQVRVESFRLGSLLRKTQGRDRITRRTGRPDVRYRGVLVVREPDTFGGLLARGVGRHRAFGFGMLLLNPAPPGL